MLRLIPKPLHRMVLRYGYALRSRLRAARRVPLRGVAVIGRDFEGQVLLVRHSYGPPGWFFPGGGIARNETPEQAAQRELAEETGCEITALKLVGESEEILSGSPHTGYLFEGIVNDMPVADGREVVEARFFPTHSLPAPLAPATQRHLQRWQGRRD